MPWGRQSSKHSRGEVLMEEKWFGIDGGDEGRALDALEGED
jgi:hypothetical protein